MIATKESGSEEIYTSIMRLARRQGAISSEDILASIPYPERDVPLLEDVLEGLLEAGVEVDDPHQMQPDSSEQGSGPSFSSADLQRVREAARPWLQDETDIVEDLGYQQALESDDVVGLYLKEAGRVSLLTAEEEVELARTHGGPRLRERATRTRWSVAPAR